MNRDRTNQTTSEGEGGVPAVSAEESSGCFALARAGRPVPLWTDPTDHPGVIRAVDDLKADLGRVTGTEPGTHCAASAPAAPVVVIVGTLGMSRIVGSLARAGKIDGTVLAGKRETFLAQVVDRPFPDIERALVIAGSDKRGTIFGVYDVSGKIGVSPWYWWADAPVVRRPDLFVKAGSWSDGEPKVRYRGIFLNDEEPALTKWAIEKFGGLNHQFYEKLFELILRLKGNFLWPAMWGKSFFDDDPQNPAKAHEYGVVIGTSHHEPCLRAHDEWRRYGTGPWNYEKNETVLREFWREGVRRMNGYESFITVGMRGDGDEPMSEESNVALLKRIVGDQRTIIAEVTGRPSETVPQVWAVYKEVQDYYDKGMEVPGDITIILCDDNWGNLRRVPRPGSLDRAGGFGLYYHFDYVGDPRNYKWLNTSPIARVWEQLRLAFDSGIDRIWVVNVGDLKPMEFPMSFFLDFAWDPDRWPVERLPEYGRLWAESIFGKEHASRIAAFIARYTLFNGRRKPELLSPDTYSLLHYREADTVVADYNALAAEVGELRAKLASEYRDAFDQLVLLPVKACANLNELYAAAAKNRLYAAQGRAETNMLAARVRTLFARDQEISDEYNHSLAGGKWNHFMDQTHIGYTTWQQPGRNVPPAVVEIEPPAAAEMGVAAEGSAEFWPQTKTALRLPEFDAFQRQTYYIDVFNRGREPFSYEAKAAAPWARVSPANGSVATGQRLVVHIDWGSAPVGLTETSISVSGPNGTAVIGLSCRHPMTPHRDAVRGFVEGNGFVCMEAGHFTRAVDRSPYSWIRIPDLGRTLSGVTARPTNAAGLKPGADGPRLEYDVHLLSEGKVRVHVYASPSLDFRNAGGLRYAVSFDDQPPQTVNLHADFDHRAWQRAVSENVRVTSSEHRVAKAGDHVLKVWLVDSGVVLEKIVVDAGGAMPCYLGPPESFRRA